jgi:uncharacterized membrane protein required for colicin V production
MKQWFDIATNTNWITALCILIVAVSIFQGMRRGAMGSARHLIYIVMEGVVTIAALYFAWKWAEWFSPAIESWLTAKEITIPAEPLGSVKQMFYTWITSVRDFPLLRFGLSFLLGYLWIRQVLQWISRPIYYMLQRSDSTGTVTKGNSLLSGLLGGVLGSVVGAGRMLMVIVLLFVITTLLPQNPISAYIQSSGLYQKAASEIIEPISGELIAEKLPVFTRAVEDEFKNILQRKYEVIDHDIPDHIEAAAIKVVSGAETDEEKARMLYQWVGTRISYDWEKVRLYEEEKIWKEQTPEETFRTRMGVCIDYSRLYAVMARAVDLEVKVVTGLGYDGRGGYGPHAWNEVYLSESDEWVPLDSTWVASGGNWFNPPNFDQTHVKDA